MSKMNIDIKYNPYDHIKDFRLDLRLFYGYSAKEVRKMSNDKVIEVYKLHTKDIKI